MKQIVFGKGEETVKLLPKMANRHGLIAGATGTGKTISLQVLAEGFSSIGTSVFIVDVKGDLSGLGAAGQMNPKIEERLQHLGIGDFQFESFPLEFWDLFEETGLPVRTSISEMGPILLSKLMELNDVQSGILNIAFKVADDMNMLLLDLKDLRSMLNYLSENAAELRADYGNITSVSIGTILRKLLILEEQGAEGFFSEPCLDVKDFMLRDRSGKGIINILNAQKLYLQPALYSTFLLWILSEVFEELEEVGDLEAPKFVLFFDEAHLIFKDIPKVLLDKVEQVVRLIRSKGVGVYFITQSPSDIPENVLAQLGNKVQHALRAYTPNEQKNIKAVAGGFRENPNIDTQEVIMSLKTGEALVSFLDEHGAPSMVQQVIVCPPKSKIGPISSEEIKQMIEYSYFKNKYAQKIDRESAYEILNERTLKLKEQLENERLQKEEEKRWLEEEKEREKVLKEQQKEQERLQKEQQKEYERLQKEKQKEIERQIKEREREIKRQAEIQQKENKKQMEMMGKMTNTFMQSFTRQVGSSLARGLMGTFKKKK